MLIYLRHGDDRGDDIYQHDRRLTTHGKKKAARKAARLITKYGHPSVVCVSPFRRALDTLEAMTACFEHRVEIRPDPKIAQHLSKKQQRTPSISPETQAQVTLVEDRATFHRRVTEHLKEMQRYTGIVWCITHQAIIEQIGTQLGVALPKSLDFLDHVIMLR